jgi:hypothetical protein
VALSQLHIQSYSSRMLFDLKRIFFALPVLRFVAMEHYEYPIAASC